MTDNSFINYIKLPPLLSPHEADDMIKAAKAGGAGTVIVLFDGKDDPFSAVCGKKLLSLLRSAMRHSVKLCFADDSFEYSGTAFGQLASVPDLWCRKLIRCTPDDILDDDIVLFTNAGETVAARICEYDDRYPYGHYPDLTQKYASELVIDSFYSRFVNLYKKFAAYELSGFIAVKPSFTAPYSSELPYCGALIKNMDKNSVAALFDDPKAKNAYMSDCRRVMENDFLLPLKSFCESRGLSFSVIGDEKGASDDFCAEESAYIIPSSFPSGGLAAVTLSAASHTDAVLNIRPGSLIDSAAASLRQFLRNVPQDAERVIVNEGSVALSGKNAFLLLNTSSETISCSIAPPEGDWFIKDPEKNAVYNFSCDILYEFSPYGFLFITSEASFVFADELPTRVGAVRTAPRGEPVPIPYVMSERTARFSLADEPLFGRQLEAEGSFSSCIIKLGSTQKALISPPFSVPLFDFYRGADVEVTAENGIIDNIFLIEDKQGKRS